jgi:hypothetical protein
MICANALDMLHKTGRFGACNTASALTPQAVRSIAMAERQKARNQYSDKRPIRIEGDIAYVPLTQGYEAIIDASDVHLVDGVSWFPMASGKTVYARRIDYSGDKPRKVWLHRAIMGDTDGLEIDHIDCDGLNNRRRNLRPATRSQNLANKQIYTNNTSGFKGVSWKKGNGKWVSYIKANGQQYHLGYFDTPEAAHAVYAKASEKLHGEFGRLS